MPEPLEQLDQAIEALLRGAAPGTGPDRELEALTEVARGLCELPSENFRVQLKRELQRRATMTTSTAIAAGIGAGFRTITPFLIHSRAPELVEFLKAAFHAEELKRNTAGEPDGFYSEVRIGDTSLMIAGGPAASRGNLPSALHVYVDDCDGTYRRALEAGAVTLMGALGEPADRPYGERSAFVQDAFGNYWYIATRLTSPPDLEGLASVMPYLHPQGARKYIEFLKQAFGAEELGVYGDAGRVMHAVVRVGNSVVEMGEPEDPTGIPVNGLFLFVEDVEAAYARALAAGATAIRPPADTPHGMRSAIVRDPGGYLWWPARWIA